MQCLLFVYSMTLSYGHLEVPFNQLTIKQKRETRTGSERINFKNRGEIWFVKRRHVINGGENRKVVGNVTCLAREKSVRSLNSLSSLFLNLDLPSANYIIFLFLHTLDIFQYSHRGGSSRRRGGGGGSPICEKILSGASAPCSALARTGGVRGGMCPLKS